MGQNAPASTRAIENLASPYGHAAVRAAVEPLEGRWLLSGTSLSVTGDSPFESYAGVGFRENPVADFSGLVNPTFALRRLHRRS